MKKTSLALALALLICLFFPYAGQAGDYCRDLAKFQSRGQCDHCDLNGCNLKKHLGTDFAGVKLTWCDLRNNSFKGVNLRGANLSNSHMQRNNLSGADLAGSTLNHVDLKGANLKGANLRNAHLRGANLSGANLSGANLSFAWWTDGRRCAAGSTGKCRKGYVPH